MADPEVVKEILATMTKQEEIREGIAKGLAHCDIIEWEELTNENKQHYLSEADRIRNYLHSQGVVIKVDRELPNVSKSEFEEWCGSHLVKDCGETTTMCEDYCRELARIDKAGYPAGFVAVKPLILKEKQ